MKKGAIHLEMDCTFRGTRVKFLGTKRPRSYSTLVEIDGEKGAHAVRTNRMRILFTHIYTQG